MPDIDADLSALIERHAGFWTRAPADRPLLAVGAHAPLEPNPDVPLKGGRWATESAGISPEDLDLEGMLRQWPPPATPTDGDFLREAAPYGLCWMEGIVGARVHAASGSIWSEPVPFPWADVGRLRARLGADNPWYETLREYLTRLAERTGGHVSIAHPLMRGPIDMVEALVGSEALAFALHDYPAELEEALAICADTFIRVGRAVPELTPEFQGGRSAFGIWAPGTVIRLQADHAVLLSPSTYRARLAHHERRIAAAFDFAIFHLHSICSHVLDVLLEIESLAAIQVTLDAWPAGPRLGALLSELAKVQAAGKSLLISGGPVSRQELDEALASLPAAGLALQVQIGSTWD